MSARRIRILDPAGNVLYPDATRNQMMGERYAELGQPAQIDVSDIPNADAAAPFLVVVEEQCNLEAWHAIGQVPLPNWADDAWRTQGKVKR